MFGSGVPMFSHQADKLLRRAALAGSLKANGWLHAGRSVISSLLSVLTCVVLVTGCASLTPEQCRHADWRQIGFADGSQGLPGARIDDHAKACAEQGIRPALNEYLQGRAQGLYSYCQPENGFAVGRRGAVGNVGDCPDSLKQAFLNNYRHGNQVYLLESQIAQQRTRLERNLRQLHRHDERIAMIQEALGKKDLAEDERSKLVQESRRLLDDKKTLNRENAYLRADGERLQMHLYLTLGRYGF